MNITREQFLDDWRPRNVRIAETFGTAIAPDSCSFEAHTSQVEPGALMDGMRALA